MSYFDTCRIYSIRFLKGNQKEEKEPYRHIKGGNNHGSIIKHWSRFIQHSGKHSITDTCNRECSEFSRILTAINKL